MKKLFYTLMILVFLSIPAQATNYYFANSGSGGSNANDCLTGNPCETLTKAQSIIDGATEESTLYFNRGDTWEVTSSAESKTIRFLDIGAEDEIIHIDAYGAGAKPKFDGMVTDFETVVEHDQDGNIANCGTGPCMWTPAVKFAKSGCSIKNMHFDRIYGTVIGMADAEVDSFTLESSDITNFGYAAFSPSLSYGTRNSNIKYNLIHTGAQLYRFGRYYGAAAPFAVSFAPWNNNLRDASGNTVSYNVMYDLASEGIHGFGYTAEYNIIGDTSSIGIFICPRYGDLTNTTIRYNLITMSGSSIYKAVPEADYVGIAIWDEGAGGDNSSGTIEIYGNTIINRSFGIQIDDPHDGGETFAEIRIFNNTIIDSNRYNIYIGVNVYDDVPVGKGQIYNNTSILYDNTGTVHVLDQIDPADFDTYWLVSNNHYWTEGGGLSVDSDWDTSYQIGDPLLPGEPSVNWDGLAAGDPRGLVTWANITPNNGSGLLTTGKSDTGWEATFLAPTGTDFSALPSTPTFATEEQPGSWTIGAALQDAPDITDPEVVSATIAEDGVTVTIVFTETVDTTGSDDGDFNFSCTGSSTRDVDLEGIAGSGTTRTFTVATIYSIGTDTCVLDYTGGADEIEDAALNDLAGFTEKAITNNSLQNPNMPGIYGVEFK